MERLTEAAIIAAIMQEAGITKLFIGNEILEGWDRNVAVSIEQDFMRDGYVFRLIDMQEGPIKVPSRVEIERKEIEGA